MVRISTDHIEVYNFLEKSENLLTDFSRDEVLLIDDKDDCYVILYTASSRNFVSFHAENCLQESDVLPLLLNTLQEYPAAAIVPHHLIEEAIKLVENKMHSQNNYRFFFDAH